MAGKSYKAKVAIPSFLLLCFLSNDIMAHLTTSSHDNTHDLVRDNEPFSSAAGHGIATGSTHLSWHSEICSDSTSFSNISSPNEMAGRPASYPPVCPSTLPETSKSASILTNEPLYSFASPETVPILINTSHRRVRQGPTYQDLIDPLDAIQENMHRMYLPRSYQQCFVLGVQSFRQVYDANDLVQTVLQSRPCQMPLERDALFAVARIFIHGLEASSRGLNNIANFINSEMVLALHVNGDLQGNLEETDLVIISRIVATRRFDLTFWLWDLVRKDRVSFALWRNHIFHM